jgi:hypothetical protein
MILENRVGIVYSRICYNILFIAFTTHCAVGLIAIYCARALAPEYIAGPANIPAHILISTADAEEYVLAVAIPAIAPHVKLVPRNPLRDILFI